MAYGFVKAISTIIRKGRALHLCTMSQEASTLQGDYKRPQSAFRNWVGKNTDFPPERNRYHLYASYACPWASRCLAVYYMKGLDGCVGLSITHPTWLRTRPDLKDDSHCGWVFRSPSDAPVTQVGGFGSFPCDGCIPDTVNGFSTMRQLYEVSKDTAGKYSVPVLWDKKSGRLVSNESSDIAKMFNSEFQDYCVDPSLDLAPDDLQADMAEVDGWVYADINDGVYKCGFAKSQEAYDAAMVKLYAALDRAEKLLEQQRYLCGDRLTLSDIFLFVTLVRFDEVYNTYFKCNVKCLREYPNLSNYVRDVYQMPGVDKSVNMNHIKTHYYSSHPTYNYYAIVPTGPGVDLNAKHDRDRF